jgi:hypothetical protein
MIGWIADCTCCRDLLADMFRIIAFSYSNAVHTTGFSRILANKKFPGRIVIGANPALPHTPGAIFDFGQKLTTNNQKKPEDAHVDVEKLRNGSDGRAWPTRAT